MDLPKKTIPATEMKNRFGDYLGEVIRRKEPILVERHGRPVAVVIGAEEWKELQKESALKKSIPWIEELKQLTEKIAKRHPHAKPYSAVDLIRQIREEEF